MEDNGMTQISTLAEVDPVFREVVSKLYPALDPRELWDISKSMPDQSAVHVTGDDRKRERRLAATGLAATGVAGVGGLHALGMTGKKALGHRYNYEGLHQAKNVGRIARAMEHVPGGAKTVAAAGTVGWLGLHTTELAGDMLGARAQVHAYRQNRTGKKDSISIKKSEALEIFEPIIKARREGVISTEKALEMIADVEKGLLDSKAIRAAVTHPKDIRQIIRYPHGYVWGKEHPEEFKELAQKSHEDVNRAISGGRLIGGTVAGGGAVAYGVHRGRKAKRKQEAQIPLMKNDDGVDYEFTGEISKVDEDKRQVFGWCSLSTVDGRPVVDLQNDYISIEEIEKSAYDYVKTSRKGGDMHARVGEEPMHVSDLIESVVITPEKLMKMGVPEESITKMNTGWWVGFKVNDDAVWQKVKANERTGFSIHGKGSRVEKVLDD